MSHLASSEDRPSRASRGSLDGTSAPDHAAATDQADPYPPADHAAATDRADPYPPADHAAAADQDSVLVGGGAMGALIRAFDWSTTPVGPIGSWPQSLRTALSMLLDSLYPMLILWGSEYVQFYNDAYRPVLGATKHPGALGQRARDCWPEIWDMIGPMFERVLTRGEATWSEDLLFVLDRNGYLEETYFTFCYSAIRDESNAPGGVLVTCVETTGRVLGERRLRCLRELAAQAAQADTAEAACALAARTLAAHAADVPFALLYVLDDQGTRARLVGTAGLEPGTPASPLTIDLGAQPQEHTPQVTPEQPQEGAEQRAAPGASDAVRSNVALPGAAPAEAVSSSRHAVWPLAVVVQSGQAVVVSDVQTRVGRLPGGPWPESPSQALVLPLARPGDGGPTGVLVAGLSPRRALDDDYRGFLDLVAGQIATAVANARAREEEHRRAAALAELDRAKTAFFSNVSHEFRTPLTLLLGPLEEALAAPPDTPLETERAAIESAHRNGLRLLRLVNTLLDFSRIEAGRVDASYEPTDLATLTAELASVFRSAMERAGLRLLVDCPPLPEPVYVDRDMWEKIVLNLLSNAFKFTFEGEIVVRLSAAGAQVQLEVCDTGTGIPPQDVPHLFERFHRIRGARSRTHEGTGIGLALVRELVTLHGGTIDVQSAVEAGTRFVVTLPLGTAHLPAERIGTARTLASTALGAAPYVEEALHWLPDLEALPSAARAQRSGGAPPPPDSGAPTPAGMRPAQADAPAEALGAVAVARVLLADDNADMRAYLRRLLGARYAVEAVTSGAEALTAAQAQPPDLVLADVMMPGLGGLALVQALRADPRTRTLPVLLLSARAGQEAVAEGLHAGADDYLVKPFTASELLARVQAHLALARLRREARDALMAERDRLQTEVAARVRAEEELRHSHQQLRVALVQLQTLQAISEAAFAQLALPALLRQVLERITAALGVDNTAILLLDEAEQTLVVHDAVGPEEAQTGQMRVPVGRGVAGTIAATRQPLILPDLRAVEPVNPLLREQMASLLGVPLLVEGRLLGVLHVDSATPRQFTEEELHLLQLVADRVALALDNARLYDAERVARAAVTAERDRLRQILDTLPVGVLTLDAAGQIDLVNAAGRDMLGVDEQGRPAPPGAAVTDGGPPGRHRRPTAADALLSDGLPLARSLREGAIVTGAEARLRQAVTGQDIPVLINSAPLHDAAGTLIGAVAAFQDLTALRELERARETFLSAAAHDLKTPLTGIRGQAQLAQRRLARLELPETAAVLAQLTRIQESSDAMVTLIDELVDVTRQQLGGGLDLHRATTDLVALVQESVESYQAASGRVIQLEVAVPALPAEVDAARLARVVGNLLSNALKYSAPASAIGVWLGQEEGDRGPEAVLVVRDAGIGIPAADLPHIFERFTRARNVAEHIQGTGIGLASAQGIVEQHGGTITVESAEGVGSTFTVRLPLAPP